MDELKKEKPVVLVAEDTNSNYLLVSAILKKDYVLYRANDGVEAVEMSRTIEPDIILMDICMPNVDGLDATVQIRAFNPNVPIIAVTAYAFESDHQRAMDAGCTDFLTKPISIVKLKEIIKKWV